MGWWGVGADENDFVMDTVHDFLKFLMSKTGATTNFHVLLNSQGVGEALEPPVTDGVGLPAEVRRRKKKPFRSIVLSTHRLSAYFRLAP